MAKPRRKSATSRKATRAAPARKRATVKAKPKKKAAAKKPAKKPRTAKKPAAKKRPRTSTGVPQPIPASQSATGAVVQIVDSEDPIGALRAFLESFTGQLTVQQGQIALGSAQLMLLPLARFARDPHDLSGRHHLSHKGSVQELLDLILPRWGLFPERSGFHAQEFLRNALAAEGLDRDRLGQLVALIPHEASADLKFNLACAYAAVGDRPAMLRAARTALTANTSPEEFMRDGDFADYADDPELAALLEREAPPPINVDVRPYVTIVRAALDQVIATLREYGETVKLEPPASLDAILAAERVAHVQLPNDYRALLTISDGMKLLDHQFFGTLDYRTETALARRARSYLSEQRKFEILAGSQDATGIEDCVPLASWGQPNDWLLYDPFGRYRGGEPGIVLMLGGDEHALDGIAGALEQFEDVARDVLGTN